MTEETRQRLRGGPELTRRLDRAWLVGELKTEEVQAGTGGDIHGVTGEVNAPPAICLGPPTPSGLR